MSFNFLPDFKVFHSILLREVSYAGVLEARQSYNYMVELKTKYGGEILLPKQIDDKIKKNLTPQQKSHFYSLVTIDNSTSGEAGFDYSNCLVETAIANSYKRRTIIVAVDEVPFKDRIINSKKIILIEPYKFITVIETVKNFIATFDPTADFIDFLTILFFLKPELINKLDGKGNPFNS